MAFSRSFKVSLLISTLIHLGAFAALNQESVAQRILGSPVILLARKSEPKIVRFELVETPASAEVSEPPEKTNLISDKTTRAQDNFRSDKKLHDSPHMEGKHEDSKDTRPRMVVSRPPVSLDEQKKPQKTVGVAPSEKPSEKAEPQREEKKISPEPPDETQKKLIEPEESIEVAPERKEKEVIQLAKKAPAPAEPAVSTPPSMAPRVISAASSRNVDADAQITGELSFGATRHFFGEYLLTMKQAVERQWVSRLISRYTGIVSSRAVVDFKIQPDGSVTDVVVNSAEGDPYFALVCVSSIDDAQPFDKIPYNEIQGLPDEFVNKPLNIRFTFQYN
ncbi:MAG: hypothetical protein JSV16_04105 [Candidatus Hydrogenedentota bacterium]|nr:MAG: hypothetical protein JSV16_04105 [Candidatus Hydrogenedentota bacterium]